jgi:hypothetical protein
MSTDEDLHRHAAENIAQADALSEDVSLPAA